MMLATLIGKGIDTLHVGILRKIPDTVFRYLGCGAITASLDAVWYYIIYHYIVAERSVEICTITASSHIVSLAIVFPITFFTGFWLNRNVAFRATRLGRGRQLARYLLTVVGSIVLNYISMRILVEWVGVWPTPSKILTTGVCAVYSYIVGRYFTFSR